MKAWNAECDWILDLDVGRVVLVDKGSWGIGYDTVAQ
jgi:hypothetical protein